MGEGGVVGRGRAAGEVGAIHSAGAFGKCGKPAGGLPLTGLGGPRLDVRMPRWIAMPM